MLEAENLMVFFENALALNGFSMQVKPGEIIGVIGSNSAGKTTLMNTLSGLIIDMRIKEKRKGGERISVYGRVLYKGKDISDCPPDQRVKLGIVLSRERHPIFPESSVAENFLIAGYLRKTRRNQPGQEIRLFPVSDPGKPAQAKSRVFKRRGAADAGHRHGAGGQARAAAAGRTASGPEPPDAESRDGCHPGSQQREGITVILSEQFARPVLPVINRGYVVENGMLTLTGTGKELMHNPEIKAAYFGV